MKRARIATATLVVALSACSTPSEQAATDSFNRCLREQEVDSVATVRRDGRFETWTVTAPGEIPDDVFKGCFEALGLAGSAN